jgi:cold-inducible RNA-binding protein
MNIYVGNLSWEMIEDDLRTAFGEFGEVSSVSILKDKFTGRSRGFGFVEMPNKEEADKAISQLNGREMKGRAIKVNEAKPRTDSPRREGGRGGFGGDRGFGGGRRF